MYTLSINMWFQKLMKQFFFGVDQVVYNFISTIYDLLIAIARTSVLSQADILDMADRIYKLLAVFMIFKVTFSLIMYVVNPDDFSDKSKGVAKLGTNIIISLSMLILTPYIFNYAYRLQTIILEDNSLATLIFGQDKECGGEGQEACETDFINTAGDEIAYITMSAFFTPNTSISELQECVNLTDGKGYVRRECSGLNSYVSDYSYIGDDEGSNSLAGLTEAGSKNPNFKFKDLQNYVAGVDNRNLGLMFRQEMAVATTEDNETFIMDYKYIFSTVVGVVVVLLLLTFCMDVALRSIKLSFLQLVAPIPILSYVDPKSGKDGLFKKWYQLCFKTYLSLFIRLLALYFAIYIIDRVADMTLVDIVDGTEQKNPFIAIFIIIGALMFAKQLPEILKGLGINLDGGGFTLNPLKKLEKDAIGGKQLSKAAGMPVKYAGRAAKGLGTAALVGGAAFATGQGLRGMGKAFGGAMKGEKFGKNFSASYSSARARKKQLDEMEMNGVTPGDVRRTKMYNAFHGQTRADHIKGVSAGLKAIQDDYSSYEKTAAGVDAIAKDLDKRKKAAEAAGDYAEIKKWSDAFDSRVKEIASGKGKVLGSLTASDGTHYATINSDGSYQFDDKMKAKAETEGKFSTNAALSNIAHHMDTLVEEMNKQGANVSGYQKISGSSSQDIKGVKNQAQGSQQSVDTDEENRKIENISNYTNQKK